MMGWCERWTSPSCYMDLWASRCATSTTSAKSASTRTLGRSSGPTVWIQIPTCSTTTTGSPDSRRLSAQADSALRRRAHDAEVAYGARSSRGSGLEALAHDALAGLHDGRDHALLVGLARQSRRGRSE